MTAWQQIIVLLYALLCLGAFIKGFHEVKNKKNSFGLANRWSLLGVFVWGDAIVLGLFWLIACFIVLFLQDWYLFLLSISLFWVVRSAGEVIYWLNEQFAGKNRNPPHTLMFYSFFNGDAIWFIYQLYWQCILVVSLLTSLYFAVFWIQSRF